MDTAFEINRPIVFFDGKCAFCNSSVRFIIHWEKDKQIQFASLDSDLSKKLLSEVDLPDSLIYFENGQIFTESSAVFKISKHLKVPFSWLTFLSFVPKIICDFFYQLVAKNRYRLFGKSEYCVVISRENKSRFIQ